MKAIASLMNDFIKRRVAATAATPAEIVADAVRIPSDGLPEEALRPIAEELVKTAIQNMLMRAAHSNSLPLVTTIRKRPTWGG